MWVNNKVENCLKCGPNIGYLEKAPTNRAASLKEWFMQFYARPFWFRLSFTSSSVALI